MHELDQTQLRAACERSAAGFDEADFLCAETRSRLLERLTLMTLRPTAILDLGGGTGAGAAALGQLYPEAQVVNLDWSPAMLSRATGQQRICARTQQLPFADASFDLVTANLSLPGCDQPEYVFAEANRVLRSPGLLLFNTLGPDTLREVRKAWAAVDPRPRVHDFVDMHNVGDALVQAGFREPVMDVEKLTVTYQAIDRLVTDLRNLAATNRHPRRPRGLTPRRLWNDFLDAADRLRNAAGALPVSVELISGQAWTGPAARGVQMADGIAAFPVERLRGGRPPSR
ncbi:MAG: methyltransferase domain-containing protein [Gammaproteobacteria bacterium]|jgi:malonyl-CoA O-methyltransferase|nr:methyltransferase domain-containing protein [Gammaproteobacteria bacterium]